MKEKDSSMKKNSKKIDLNLISKSLKEKSKKEIKSTKILNFR